MLYCDLTLNGTSIWYGVPCLNSVDINSFRYLGFTGKLIFIDTTGINDPTYEGLADRYILFYFADDVTPGVQVPLQATPSQQLSIVLNGQDCVISIYEKNAPPLLSVYLVITAPPSGLITETFTASAAPQMASYFWTLVNGVILSGQGTPIITYQALSVSPVYLRCDAVLLQGGSVYATAETIIYDASSFAITAPEYVWAGQFDFTAGIPYSGLGLTWSVAGAVRIISGGSTPTVSLDAGQASWPASISTLVYGMVASTWNFKIVPYTSNALHTTAYLPTLSYEDFEIDLGWQYIINLMATDSPALLRVYETDAARTADAGRSLIVDPNVPPTDATQIVFEGATALGTLAFHLTHSAIGTNGDSPRNKTAYCRIFNTGVSTAAIALTINRTELQIGNTF